jgi:hypothetical protein
VLKAPKYRCGVTPTRVYAPNGEPASDESHIEMACCETQERVDLRCLDMRQALRVSQQGCSNRNKWP